MTDVRDANFTASDEAVINAGDYQDYFGFGEQSEFVLPDGKQKIYFKIMNEGERAKFQKQTSKDIKFNRGTGDAAIKADPAEERHELILTSVTGWSLKKRDSTGAFVDVPFSGGSKGSMLGQWLQVADPRIIDKLEMTIRKANPWLQAEMTVEEIDKEIDNLRELREQAVERERGK